MARKGGNPNIKDYGFSAEGDEALDKTLCVKVTESMYQQVKSQDNPAEFLRGAIQKALDEQKQPNDTTES
ncbi:hypothetical protein BZZ01_32490 [Nostocales cyanobacterium HT-58-2]|nr:hypothetical protein BZZ01_32490 [Nostocales cyanobacterium HT-58-2]